MNVGPAVLGLEEDGFAVSLGTGETLAIAPGDTAAVASLRRQLRGQRVLALHVPEAATFRLALPEVPRSAAQTRAMLNDLAPVAADQLAWTRPQPVDGGGASIVVVRRSWLDPRVAEVEMALDIVPRLIVEPDGQVLQYQSPARRRRNFTTGAIVAASTAAAVIALSVPVERTPNDVAVTQPSDPWPNHGGAIAALEAVMASLPANAQIAAVAVDVGGEIGVELMVADPDALRATIARSGALHGYNETAQSREADGGYRVTYRSRVAPATTAPRMVPVLSAASRKAAVERISALLAAQASTQVVQLRIGREQGIGKSPLRLSLDLAGPQGAVLGLVDRIESGAPPARLSDWRLQSDPDGVRLNGSLTVPWSERS